MRIVSTIGATSVTHDGVSYIPDSSGVFDVPEPAGVELTRFPHWDEEWVRDGRVAVEKSVHANTLDGVLERLEKLEKAFAASHKRGPKPRI